MYPELNLKIGEVSQFSSKGTHTTVTSVMIKVERNTFIIDTPGLREIDPYGIRKSDLGHYFIEFGDYINEVQIQHLHTSSRTWLCCDRCGREKSDIDGKI